MSNGNQSLNIPSMDITHVVDSQTSLDEIGHHLTESVLTLQTTIQNIQQDVEGGIAPSIIMPTDSDQSSGTFLLTLEPSSTAIQAELTPLIQRLLTCEQTLKQRSQWHPPATPPQSPEYSIIDISDLSSAIGLLENILDHTTPSNASSPQHDFSKYLWTWEPSWKEFYAHVPERDICIFLSRWHLNEARNVWEHISMASVNIEPEDAAELLGSWEDWAWDPIWKEWNLDVSDDEGRQRIYAGQWQQDANGGWTYVGQIGG